VLFPLGAFVHERYATEILPLCKARNVGSVCFKTFGAGKLLGDTAGYGRPLEARPRGKWSSGGKDVPEDGSLPRLRVQDCVSYTLTHDPDVTLLGMSFPNEQDAALAAVEAFTPLAEAELLRIREAAAVAIRGKGPCWWNPDPYAGVELT
jgi:1-deoxyxylulose-5-phosphate synthase